MHLPLFEYPGIPGILIPAQDHPEMDAAHLIPVILRPFQDHPGMDIAHLTLSEYPRIPEIHRPSQDDPGMDRAHFYLCLSILGFPGYSDHPRVILGWPPYRVFWDFRDTSTIPGSSWDGQRLSPPYRGILGFPGYFDHPLIILGLTQSTHPPLSEYPGIPGIL